MWISRENRRCGFGSPSRDAGEAICTVTYYGQIVGNRTRLYPEFCDHSSLVTKTLAPTVELNDPRAHHTLAEVLIGRADDNSPHALLLSCHCCGRRKSIIGLELDHR